MSELQVFQKDILGQQHDVVAKEQSKTRQVGGNAKPPFRQISLADGVNAEVATSDAMLIHRILQKKLLYAGLSSEKQRRVLLRILRNEIGIKAGNIEPITASRDSLIAYFGVLKGDCA
jgi:hypothetical protein